MIAPAVYRSPELSAKSRLSSATGRVSLRRLSREDRETGRLWNMLMDITHEDLRLTRKAFDSADACWLLHSGVKLSKAQLLAVLYPSSERLL